GDWSIPGDAASDVTIGGTAAGAGNLISANGNWGIWITEAGTTGVVVQQNFVGTDVTGTAALGNSYYGGQIERGAAENTNSGTTAASGNLISANLAAGVLIYGVGTTRNVVQRNWIGTDITGTVPLGNTYSGVWISGGAADNTIGGTANSA